MTDWQCLKLYSRKTKARYQIVTFLCWWNIYFIFGTGF